MYGPLPQPPSATVKVAVLFALGGFRYTTVTRRRNEPCSPETAISKASDHGSGTLPLYSQSYPAKWDRPNLAWILNHPGPSRSMGEARNNL